LDPTVNNVLSSSSDGRTQNEASIEPLDSGSSGQDHVHITKSHHRGANDELDQANSAIAGDEISHSSSERSKAVHENDDLEEDNEDLFGSLPTVPSATPFSTTDRSSISTELHSTTPSSTAQAGIEHILKSDFLENMIHS